jgi:hypothetical protein
MPFPRRKLLTTAFIGIVWVLLVGLGLWVLLDYESAPGSTGIVAKIWPPASPIHLAGDRLTLVVAAHPHCPCTRASIGELAQIMARAQGKVNAYVLFYKPEGAASGWEDTGLRRSAAAIPGVTVLSDPDGKEAQRLGAETSGHAFLFAPDGRLLFNGGITASRGHSGGNSGESSIIAIANKQGGDRQQTFVFGCALASPTKTATQALCLK